MTELFFQNAAMPLAAWPNKGYSKIKCPNKFSCSDRHTFSIFDIHVKKWVDEPDLRATAYWITDKYDQTLKIQEVDPIHNALVLSDELNSRVVSRPMREWQRIRRLTRLAFAAVFR